MARPAGGESDAQRQARQRDEVEAYEAAHDRVPGTAIHGGDGPGGGPSGGIGWEDQARMAICRPASARTEVDWDALGRFPEPGGWVGE